ncbi:MAG TPA: dihydrolipoamide acetyltransferase family protein, partial [Anaerolineae bacterium]
AAAARAEAAAEPAPPASAEGAPAPAPVAAPPGEPDLAAEAAPAGRRVVLSNLRRTIAQRLHASQQATAAVTLNREVNATELVELRQRILADLPPGAVRPSLTDFLAFVLARSLLAHRELNGVASGETWELVEDVHLALAVDTERGLLAPVIRSAQRKGLLILAAERSDLVGRTRAGRARPEELSGGTFTLTNLGPLGVDAFTPIINPPQIAILGIGRLRTVPAFAAGQVIPAQMMVLSLTFDHRAVDGAPAARLLQDVALWIEKPHTIWLR